MDVCNSCDLSIEHYNKRETETCHVIESADRNFGGIQVRHVGYRLFQLDGVRIQFLVHGGASGVGHCGVQPCAKEFYGHSIMNNKG